MSFAHFSVLQGSLILAGLIFCGFWTGSSVSRSIEGNVASLMTEREIDADAVRQELRVEALKEYAVPLVVYILILLLVIAATLDEVRQICERRRGKVRE
ncbi:MAG: hypothetical protein AAF357_11905 [Verrucomicrobiota bacterium]